MPRRSVAYVYTAIVTAPDGSETKVSRTTIKDLGRALNCSHMTVLKRFREPEAPSMYKNIRITREVNDDPKMLILPRSALCAKCLVPLETVN